MNSTTAPFTKLFLDVPSRTIAFSTLVLLWLVPLGLTIDGSGWILMVAVVVSGATNLMSSCAVGPLAIVAVITAVRAVDDGPARRRGARQREGPPGGVPP